MNPDRQRLFGWSELWSKKKKKKTSFVFARLKASLDDGQGGGSTVTEVIVYAMIVLGGDTSRSEIIMLPVRDQ